MFLSFLLISFSFSIAHIFFAGAIITHFSAKVYTLGDPTFLLIAPLLWFYTKELIGEEIPISKRIILHFLPFLATIFLSSALGSFDQTSAPHTFFNNHKELIKIIFNLSIVVQLSTYQFIMQKKWIAFRELMKQEVSYKEDVDISWIRFFMIAFLIINLFFFFSLFITIHFSSLLLPKTTAFMFSLSVFALGYQGIMQKHILQHTKTIVDSSSVPSKETLLKPDQEVIKRIVAYMNDRKPFLDAELTLSGLAKNLNISRSQLSLIINEGLGDNFYDFVNKYRVEEVKRLMGDPKVKNYNLLGIAMEAGFKSKSTFNLIFKRFTGLTPSEYRKNREF